MAVIGHKGKEEVYRYLQPLAIAVLSTVNPKQHPYAALIYFIVDNDLNFYYLTKSDTNKSHNLKKNHHAALTIIDPLSPKTIQTTGSASEVEGAEVYRNNK